MLSRFAAAAAIAALIPVAVLAQDSPEAAPAQTDASAEDAAKDDAGKIVLELNNASDAEGGACRMTFVATNRSGSGFDAASWQVGIFDAEGIVRSILVLEFGALTDGKTKIVLFDLPGRGCADISRVVVNDVAQCRPAGGAEADLSPACLDALVTRSRGAIRFGI